MKGFFDALPIWGIYILLVLFLFISYEIGYRIGQNARAHRDKSEPSALNHLISGMLAMLAFVLAFSFSMASSQHRARRRLVLEEANTIGTAYLRADLLEEPYRGKIKTLLREYVDTRVKGASREKFAWAVKRSLEIQDSLWAQVVKAARHNPGRCVLLVVRAVNRVIDVHEKRMAAALRARIPRSIWIALLAISALTMLTMGTQGGLAETRRLIAVIPLILAFAVLTTLVVDLDRPQRGLIKVSQQEMVDLQRKMNQSDEILQKALGPLNRGTPEGPTNSSRGRR